MCFWCWSEIQDVCIWPLEVTLKMTLIFLKIIFSMHLQRQIQTSKKFPKQIYCFWLVFFIILVWNVLFFPRNIRLSTAILRNRKSHVLKVYIVLDLDQIFWVCFGAPKGIFLGLTGIRLYYRLLYIWRTYVHAVMHYTVAFTGICILFAHVCKCSACEQDCIVMEKKV